MSKGEKRKRCGNKDWIWKSKVCKRKEYMEKLGRNKKENEKGQEVYKIDYRKRITRNLVRQQ